MFTFDSNDNNDKSLMRKPTSVKVVYRRVLKFDCLGLERPKPNKNKIYTKIKVTINT